MANCSGSMESAPIRVQHDYAVGGIQLKFPCKPYPTQMAMMAKVINGACEVCENLINTENSCVD